MDFDIWLPTANPFATPELLAAVAREGEARGVHTMWVGEHVVTFDSYSSRYPYAESGQLPMPHGSGLLEPFTTLAFLAGITSTVRLGTAMCLLPQRNPVYCAKEVATLDWLSGGRVELGVGVGWLREEFEALGVPFEGRGARTDEYLEVLRTLWCDDVSSYTGTAFELPSCTMFPKPVQDPHPPLHVGGESDAALRRVARGAQGWHTFNRTPDELEAGMGRLARALEAAGRSRRDVTVTVCPYFRPIDAASIERYAEAGADAVAALLFAVSAQDVPAAFEALDPCLDRARAC